MDPIIVETVKLDCAKEKAFEMFTENNNLERWLTTKADVEPREGGKYELFWEPDDPENNSTIGCKVLAIDQPNYLTFEWKGPKQHRDFMNNVQPLTNVTVFFTTKENQTIVTLIHTGWRDTEEWDLARKYFVSAWKGAFLQLKDIINE